MNVDSWVVMRWELLSVSPTRRAVDAHQGAGGRHGTVMFMLTPTYTERPVVTEELLRRLDVNGPRYTSYPTADRFVDAFGPDDYARALAQRQMGAV